MTIRVTRAQLRKLRGSLRDGRSLALKIQPQLLAAYRLTSAGREQFSQASIRSQATTSGFQIVVSRPGEEPKKEVKKRRRVERKQVQKTRYTPTQILGRRSSPGDAAREKQEKSRVVTIHDLAAQIPVTVKKETPRIDPTGLRLVSGALLRAVIDMLR